MKAAFEYFDLDWRKRVVQDQALPRRSDISYSAANPRLANTELGWTARHSVGHVVRNMCRAQSE